MEWVVGEVWLNGKMAKRVLKRVKRRHWLGFPIVEHFLQEDRRFNNPFFAGSFKIYGYRKISPKRVLQVFKTQTEARKGRKALEGKR